MAKLRKVLIILAVSKGKYSVVLPEYYLKTIEELNKRTCDNLDTLGRTAASRKDKGVTEELTGAGYDTKTQAKEAADKAGYDAYTYQQLAAFVHR